MRVHQVDEEAALIGISKSKANIWLTVVWLIFVVDIMDKTAINAVLPLLKTEFQFSDAQLGAVSSVLSLSVGLLALPMAMVVDRWSRRKMIALMVGAWSFATFLTGRATGYPSMLFSRAAVGIGEAGYYPAAYALVSAWYPKRIRGLMLGILYTAPPIGTVIGVVVTGALAHSYGWRSCFGILALPGLILTVLAWFLPDYVTRKKVIMNKDESKQGVWVNALRILKSPTLLFIYFACASAVLASLGFATWGITFYVRTFGMDVKQASMLFGIVVLLSVPGAVVLGWFGDKLTRRTHKGRLIICMVCAVLFLIMITVALQVAMHGGEIRIVIVCWTIASFFLLGIGTNLFSTVQDLAAPEFRATAAGFIPLVQQVLGGFTGPILIGFLSDHVGIGTALQIISVLSVILLLVFCSLAVKYYRTES